MTRGKGETTNGERKTSETGRRSASDVNLHIGARLRLRRMLAGMSQQQLAERLGVSFQQVQKYEKGTNQLSAFRLQQLAEIFELPIQAFFEDFGDVIAADGTDGNAASTPTVADPYAVRVMIAFRSIQNNYIKRCITDLAEAVAQDESLAPKMFDAETGKQSSAAK